ncbi:peroxisome proliferator-activated receptor gamma-like isoform x6 [Plakobranchus ocellatus]|uniref:Peroxisome proliferator-activated receptor gamma-like isoform x6 n=1 Tax=Plakobranchus ocellatus TaxID=259542 RepID=A0AAV4BTW7_9GAST|nr:peroxisome proliferator-activated receptor gamma-like isoform x6 [Plakobranchus ocellatus]
MSAKGQFFAPPNVLYQENVYHPTASSPWLSQRRHSASRGHASNAPSNRPFKTSNGPPAQHFNHATAAYGKADYVEGIGSFRQHTSMGHTAMSEYSNPTHNRNSVTEGRRLSGQLMKIEGQSPPMPELLLRGSAEKRSMRATPTASNAEPRHAVNTAYDHVRHPVSSNMNEPHEFSFNGSGNTFNMQTTYPRADFSLGALDKRPDHCSNPDFFINGSGSRPVAFPDPQRCSSDYSNMSNRVSPYDNRPSSGGSQSNNKEGFDPPTPTHGNHAPFHPHHSRDTKAAHTDVYSPGFHRDNGLISRAIPGPSQSWDLWKQTELSDGSMLFMDTPSENLSDLRRKSVSPRDLRTGQNQNSRSESSLSAPISLWNKPNMAIGQESAPKLYTSYRQHLPAPLEMNQHPIDHASSISSPFDDYPGTRRGNGHSTQYSDYSSSDQGSLYSQHHENIYSPDTVSQRSPSGHFQDDPKYSSGTKKSDKSSRGARNLPPCRVCGNKASGLHFGVNTCEACNEFFRRSLKRGADYHCSRNLSCKVWGKKRSPCSSCRYRRCLEVGMSRNRIKTGRYSHRTRAEYAQEIEKNKRIEAYEQEHEWVVSMLTTLVENHDRYIRNCTHIPEEDIYRMQQQFLSTFNAKKRHPQSHKTHAGESGPDKRGSHNANSSSTSTATYEGDPEQAADFATAPVGLKICSDTEKFLENIKSEDGDARTSTCSFEQVKPCEDVDFALETSSCLKLSVDRSGDSTPGSLLEESTDSSNHSVGTLNRPGNIDNIQYSLDNADQVSSADVSHENSEDSSSGNGSDSSGLTKVDADITERWLRCFISYAKVIPGFKKLPICDQASLVRTTWFEFWFLGAYRGFNTDLRVVTYPIGYSLHESQLKRVFGEEFCSTTFHLASRMKTLKLSSEEMVLMKTICLLSPDRCELKDKKGVEKIYWTMVSALLHMLEKNKPKDRLIFPKIVGKMVELRTLSDIALRAHGWAYFPDMFPQKPLLGEVVEHVQGCEKPSTFCGENS